MKNRSKSREEVFALLFEWSFRPELPVAELLENTTEAQGTKLDIFGQELLDKTVEYQPEIDKIIEEYSQKWSFQRISKISLAALRLALAELKYMPDIPPAVSVNEAVEIVKKYGTEDESGYINGILGAYIRAQ